MTIMTAGGRRALIGASLCVAGLCAAPALNGTERIAVRVSPEVAIAPATVNVRTQVEADDQNRVLEITIQSDDFYTSSEVQLDGLRAPRTSTFQYRGLPAGTYDVTAVLLDSAGHRSAASRGVTVAPSSAP